MENKKDLAEKVKESANKTKKTAPHVESEPTHKLSSKEVRNSDDIYLEPVKKIHGRDKPNEDHAEARKKAWEYVEAIAQNNESIGDGIELWSKPFGGDPACFWNVPVNKPVFIPLHLAQQIKGCRYTIYKMEESKQVSSDGVGTYMGAMIAKETRNRLDVSVPNSKITVGI